MKKLVPFLALSLVAFHSGAQPDYTKLVDPRIGTQGSGLGSGYTFIGATYPFGMVQFTPTYFAPNKGFVINQLSGAGCAHLGNFPTLPLAGELTRSPRDMTGFKPYKTLKECHAGYFSAEMEDGVICNATVTRRSAIAQFLFPNTHAKGTVLIGSGIIGSASFYNAHVTVTAPNRCEGFAEGGDFCGVLDTKYRVYFVAEFNRPASTYGTWKDGDMIEHQMAVGGSDSGAWFTFDTSEDNLVEYRISISYVSAANARENFAKDANQGGFDSLRTATEAEWNRRLGAIAVSEENPDRVVQFYTHLYHALIHPNISSDVNGEYMGADSRVHQVEEGREYYTSFSGWDTYRTQCQLLAMLFPEEASDMMQSATDFAEQAGGYGRWILANIETGVMHGDPMPIIIANTHAFGATDFDVETAFKYMKLGATIPGLRSQTVVVRNDLQSYLKKGHTGSASETLEYTSSDFAIGRFALQALGNEAEAAYFINRAQNWKKLYDPSTRWLRSRETGSGRWSAPDAGWREATKKNYFWMVPFNLEALTDTIGRDAALARLDELFVRLDASYDEDWFAGGNEPNFQVPWIYNWLGKPHKATQVMHRLFGELYNSSPSGCPGNDDLGTMGAFYVFGSIGLYPVIPGVAGFAINLPQFNEVTVQLPNGTLSVSGGDTRGYIRSMKLDGNECDLSWIDWSTIRDGGRIEYQTTSDPEPEWAVDAELPSFNGY